MKLFAVLSVLFLACEGSAFAMSCQENYSRQESLSEQQKSETNDAFARYDSRVICEYYKRRLLYLKEMSSLRRGYDAAGCENETGADYGMTASSIDGYLQEDKQSELDWCGKADEEEERAKADAQATLEAEEEANAKAQALLKAQEARERADALAILRAEENAAAIAKALAKLKAEKDASTKAEKETGYNQTVDEVDCVKDKILEFDGIRCLYIKNECRSPITLYGKKNNKNKVVEHNLDPSKVTRLCPKGGSTRIPAFLGYCFTKDVKTKRCSAKHPVKLHRSALD